MNDEVLESQQNEDLHRSHLEMEGCPGLFYCLKIYEIGESVNLGRLRECHGTLRVETKTIIPPWPFLVNAKCVDEPLGSFRVVP